MNSSFLITISKTIKPITTSIWTWIKNISTLSYSNIVKNWITILIIISCIFTFKYCSDQNTIKIIQNVINHNELIEEESTAQRVKFQPEISHKLISTMYSLNADRIFIEELHNSVKNYGGLGFEKMTMSFEEVNDSRKKPILYISGQFLEQQATWYKIPNYISLYSFFQGSVEDLYKIDQRYAYNMKNSKDVYSAMISIKGNKIHKLIGWIVVSWEDTTKVPKDKALIQNKMNILSNELEPYFKVIRKDLNK